MNQGWLASSTPQKHIDSILQSLWLEANAIEHSSEVGIQTQLIVIPGGVQKPKRKTLGLHKTDIRRSFGIRLAKIGII